MKNFVFGLIKKGIKGGKQKTTGTEVVNPFKFKPAKNKLERTIRDIHISVDKAQGKIKGDFQKMEREIDPFRRKLKQTNQKLRGEKITKSGISKGKDIKK